SLRKESRPDRRHLRRNAAEKSQISATPTTGEQQPFEQAMLHRREVGRLRQWPALRIGYRDHRYVGKHAIERFQFRQIQSAVQGGEERHTRSSENRIAEIVAVQVNDIEVARTLRDLLKHGEQGRYAVADCRIESKRSFAAWL